MAADTLRVLIVDDQPLWRTVLAAHLSEEIDFQVIGQAPDGATALALAGSEQPDLVVLDLDLAGDSGTSLLGPLRQVSPASQVVVLSGTAEVEEVVAAFGAGAVGFVPKDSPVEEFAEALRAVALGRPVLPGYATSAVMEEFRRQASRQQGARDSAPVPTVLSDREREVLELLALGHSNRQIGGQLFISENTVKNHVRNILSKLEVSSRVEAVSKAFGTGLLATPQA